MSYHDNPHRLARRWAVHPVGADPHTFRRVPTLEMGMEISRRFVEMGKPAPVFAPVGNSLETCTQ